MASALARASLRRDMLGGGGAALLGGGRPALLRPALLLAARRPAAAGLHQSAVLLGAKRGRLTSKMGNKNYYKGKGGAPMGRHTKKGGYVIDPSRKPVYVVPDLADCEVRGSRGGAQQSHPLIPAAARGLVASRSPLPAARVCVPSACATNACA